MATFGTLIFFLWWALITPLFSLIACLIAPLPARRRYRIIALWSRLTVIALRVCCGIRHRIIGADNLPTTPSVFLSRHESAWETIAYQCILPPQAFVLKKQLLHIPFFGWGLRQMSPIAIDRSAGRQALKELYKQGAARLNAGFHIIVFPEGTRLKPEEERPYFSGGAWLAKKAGVAVIPVAVNSGIPWPRHEWRKRPGLITVRIGPPIDTADLSVDEINQQTKNWITANRRD